jgi:hypothetical protein
MPPFTFVAPGRQHDIKRKFIMQSRNVGFVASRLVLALSLAFVGVGSWAAETKTEDHSAHHSADAAAAPKLIPQSSANSGESNVQPAPMDKKTMEKMNQMETRMKAMQDQHQKFMAAKTPEERMALMPENMKTMQEAMTMMEGMQGMGMMGGKEQGQMMMDKMPADMMGMHQMMEKRMDMMQSMMQMMMDRMQAPATK